MHIRFSFHLFAPILLLSVCLGAVSGCGEQSGSKTLTVTVSGIISYEDREYSYSGFTGNTEFKSVRYAVVDLVDVQGNVVDTTATDENGGYRLSGSGVDLYVRVLSMSTQDAGSELEVSDYSGNVYAVSQPLTRGGDNQLDFKLAYQERIAGAFNILDVYTNASLFVSGLSSNPLPTLKAHWQPGSNRYGTYFCQANYVTASCPQGNGIYLYGGSGSGGDTDEYDDDVLYHEYAHYLETVNGVQDSPGGRHYLTDNDDDLRLSWSEGLGGFFPGAVKSWLKDYYPQRLSIRDSMNTTYFIDTVGTTAAISIDMADPSPLFCLWGVDCFVYSSSEVAVAKILNKLRDIYGMQAVWDVFSRYMPGGTRNPATLESFWDGWLQTRSPDSLEKATLQRVFSDRLVFYENDQYESDNDNKSAPKLAACTAANCSGEVHYLYSQNPYTPDVDLMSFDVQSGKSYYVETFDLSNGADTYMRILDSMQNVAVDKNGVTMVNNDRTGTVYCYTYDNPCRIHNDSTMLSSALTFTPASSGTYYLAVQTSPSKPAAAGRYGTYSVRVIEQ